MISNIYIVLIMSQPSFQVDQFYKITLEVKNLNIDLSITVRAYILSGKVFHFPNLEKKRNLQDPY